MTLLKKISPVFVATASLFSMSSLVTAGENVLCEVTGTAQTGEMISVEAITQRVPGFKIDSNGYARQDSGFETLVSPTEIGSHAHSPSLTIGQNGYYFERIVAPGLKLNANSSRGPAIIPINISMTSPAADAYAKTLSPGERYSFGVKVREMVLYKTSVSFKYNALDISPQSTSLAFADFVNGKLVETPVTVTCSL